MGRLLQGVFLAVLLLGFPGGLGAEDTFLVLGCDRSGLAPTWDLALRLFQAAHPGVRVVYTEKPFDELRLDSDRILMGAEVPDVMEFIPGTATAGAQAAGGRFRDLTVEAVRRGWDTLVPGALQAPGRYDARGQMGKGLWYGVPAAGDFVQVYYNRDLFRHYGVTVPETPEQWAAVLGQLHKAGVVPLALGASGYLCQELLYELFLARADQREVRIFQGSMERVDFWTPAWTGAARTLAAWASAGYFGPSAINADSQVQEADFEAGRAAMTFSGSGLFARLKADPPGFDWGTFLFPGNRTHAGGAAGVLVVPVRSHHPDWAAEFIGLVLRQDVQTALAEAGRVASVPDLSLVDDPGARNLNRTFGRLLEGGQLAGYPGWPAVGFYDSLLAGGRDLVRGVPADQVLDGLDLAYRAKIRTP